MSSKPRKKTNRPRSSGSQRTAKWVLLGAVLLLVGLVVLLSRMTADRNSQPVSDTAGPTDARSVERPPEPAPVSPEFEFYTLLPEQENRPPSRPPRSEENAAEPAESTGDEGLDAQARYLIQVGSFRRDDDAEARKAELALMGFQSRVESAEVKGVTYHRVVIGPLSGDTVPEVRRRLDEGGLESLAPRRVDG